MKINWNRAGFKYQYEKVLEDAKKRGYLDEELKSPYLDRLSHQTKSPRIMRMVSLAYYLGWLRGIESADNGLMPVTLDQMPPADVHSTGKERGNVTLIDINELYKIAAENAGFVRMHVADVDALPNIDAAPVVHGEWINKPKTCAFTCSVCGREIRTFHTDSKEEARKEYPYCHCGALMDVEVADDEG